MIDLRPTTHDERSTEYARRLDLLGQTTLGVCQLPTGGHIALVRDDNRYHLEGDLRLFGVEMFGTIPVVAVNDTDAVSQAASLIRGRWAAVLGDATTTSGGEQC